MSVHKVSRDNKLIFAFDEVNYYILNRDLKTGKILGNGRQSCGFCTLMKIKVKILILFLQTLLVLSNHIWNCRLGHPADKVINVLNPSLSFGNNDSHTVYDVSQRSKQTREYFL